MYTHYAVGVPVRKFSQSEFECLLDIIAHNAELLKKALGTDNLAVVVLLDRLWFPWFTPQGLSGEIEDYHALVSGLCALAKNRPHDCVGTDNRREVRDLIYRSGLTIKGRKPERLNGHGFLSNWYSQIAHTLSDIHTCFFKRSE